MESILEEKSILQQNSKYESNYNVYGLKEN